MIVLHQKSDRLLGLNKALLYLIGSLLIAKLPLMLIFNLVILLFFLFTATYHTQDFLEPVKGSHHAVHSTAQDITAGHHSVHPEMGLPDLSVSFVCVIRKIGCLNA